MERRSSSAIRPLKESVRNTMRSGVIVYDLTSVVEELVFNSLDAAATRVSVYFGVGSCFIKVVDDGCGISRDGLALLGERYVTSKLSSLSNKSGDANSAFGFRGEALASISNVSVVEIVTKASGRPNGYRKVIKGSKCMFFGINDEMKDVGTAVTVRDLFYNQPVRRRYIQTSPKKVLHLVRKCVHRISLVQSNVTFKVVDIESDEELLRTRPSSVLSLLVSCYGIEDPSILHELNASDGAFTLSGYLSGPCTSLSVKAFQYLYINSRFVCKSPIHKLLNLLATRYECPDPQKDSNISQKGKRSRPQAYPVYLLNLSCPSSLYELTFEPSKTYVEFKDWGFILGFIEAAIHQLWNNCNFRGGPLCEAAKAFHRREVVSKEEDLPDSFEIQRHFFDPRASFTLDVLPKSTHHIFYWEHDEVPFEEFHMSISKFNDRQADKEVACPSDYSLRSWDAYVPRKIPRLTQNRDIYSFNSEQNVCMPDVDFMEENIVSSEKCHDYVVGNAWNSNWQNDFHHEKYGAARESCVFESCLDHEFRQEGDKYNKNTFLRSCSSGKKVAQDVALLPGEDGFESQLDGFKMKKRWGFSDGNIDIQKHDSDNQVFASNPLWLDDTSNIQKLTPQVLDDEFSAPSDVLSQASLKSPTVLGKPFSQDGGGISDSLFFLEEHGSGHDKLKSDSFSAFSDALIHPTTWKHDQSLIDTAHQCSPRWDGIVNILECPSSKNMEFNCIFNALSKVSNQDNCSSNYTSSMLDRGDYPDSCRDSCKSLQDDRISLLEHSDILISQTDWLPLESRSRGCKSTCKHEIPEAKSKHPDWKQNQFPVEKSTRSHSAPPFHQPKRRFISLNHHSAKEGLPQAQNNNAFSHLEIDDLEHLHTQPQNAENSSWSTRNNINKETKVIYMEEMHKGGVSERPHCPEVSNSPIPDFLPKELQEPTDCWKKWRNGCQQISKNSMHNIDKEESVLDISSGFLHLSGSLVPESLHKNCLEGARVLSQVDKKFIPVVAGRKLAFIDQHAADERIRLEDLRSKVLSGEEKTVIHLDAEQELVLTEIGYQLLYNYADLVREWGWICNIQAHCSGSFKKNLKILHQEPTMVTLLAVPCILGVKLSDKDLLEFLHQLGDTDGSSTMPPSVLRILNLKACRGAIMFGDSLLPSECALIVEELKQTSLCFQCAHGRPTTVPLVDLESLHKLIAKLQLSDEGPNQSWHGLWRQELSIERAEQRLSTARGGQ